MLSLQEIPDFIRTLKNDDVDWFSLHWTVGRYDQTFDSDYHFQVLGDGSVHVDSNAFTSGKFNELAHVWHRNSRNIGISLCSMLGGVDDGVGSKDLIVWPKSYGDYPPTQKQISTMCKLTANLVQHYKLTIDSVRSHYQWAVIDNYADERWEYKHELPLILDRIHKEMANV